MQKRELGRTGIQVAPLMFGGNVFGWTLDEAASLRMLDAFVDSGFDFIDTADVYSRFAGTPPGESERIIGRWLRESGKRERVVLATKVGKSMGEARDGLSRRWIEQAVEDSLRRLGTDRIDLYQAHADDPATPLEETLEAFGRLVEAGKLRVIGASNYAAERLEQALSTSAHRGLPAYASLQPLYNLYDRADFEQQLAPLCLRHGLAVLPYFALAAGFLSGKYRSLEDCPGQARGGMVARYIEPRGLRILAALDLVAAELGSVPATVALAWLLAQPGVTAPIASATSAAQLATLAAAVDLRLNAEALAALDAASRP